MRNILLAIFLAAMSAPVASLVVGSSAQAHHDEYYSDPGFVLRRFIPRERHHWGLRRDEERMRPWRRHRREYWGEE